MPSISVIQENLASDYIDSVPEEMSFTYIEALALIFSILSYLVDTITDVTVATFHYLNENYWYFALTVAFVVFPTLIMTSISLRWYILDSREDWPKISKLQWLTRVLFLLFQLGPIMRYIDSLCYGLQFRKHNDMRDRKNARKYYKYMIYEDADATMLRLFECFLEAAPQLVLQIYILAVSSPHSAEDWTGLSLHPIKQKLIFYFCSCGTSCFRNCLPRIPILVPGLLHADSSNVAKQQEKHDMAGKFGF